jgi:hypothetical protein
MLERDVGGEAKLACSPSILLFPCTAADLFVSARGVCFVGDQNLYIYIGTYSHLQTVAGHARFFILLA